MRNCVCYFVCLLLIHVSGQNNQAGKSILKTDYKEDGTINDNLKLSVKILLKTLDSAAPSPERIELSVLKQADNGKIVHTTLSDDEVGSIHVSLTTVVILCLTGQSIH